MHTILPETKEAFVALEVSGKLTELDYEILIPLFETQLEEHGKIALFWELKDFHGWTAGSLWENTKFDVKHAFDFTRVAVVGDRKWEERMATFMKPFTSAEVRFFDSEDRDEAMRWARGEGAE
ncbi:MAG: STAS/SEC14 domain-containing protein [Verrucomicrobiota bacterium]